MRSLTNIAGRVLSWLSLSNLTRLSLVSRWVTFLIAVILMGVSIWATLRIKQEMIPDIEIPMTTVMTTYPGASPEDVMKDVTEPIEDALKEVRGLRIMSSTSIESLSFVFAEFEYGTDMKAVNDTIRSSLARLSLPHTVPLTTVDPVTKKEQPNPSVIPLDISMMPIVAYSISGNMDSNDLYVIATTTVGSRLAELKGVLPDYGISVDGSQESMVVTPNPSEMNANGIPMSQLVASLAGLTSYNSIQELEESLIAPTNVSVGQVADVTLAPTPGTAITRTNGDPSVVLAVTKSADANTVETANAVNRTIKELQEELPGVTFDKIFDQSDYIKESIGELTRDALVGGGLAITVIFLFLLTLRGSLVIAISIPFSVFLGFLIMSAVGVTINILTLGAMTIAVGRIVDDSIVVLEVIYRRLRQGQGFKRAAFEGAREVAMPIASATLATVAIFIPLAFVGGIVGEMFLPFALTITFALLSSLLVSLTLVPALSSVLVPKKISSEAENAWYQRLYGPALKWALAHRAITVVVTLALFLGSLALLPVVGTSFMPPMGMQSILVEVEMPLGTPISDTNNRTKQVEQIIEATRTNGNSAIDLYYTTVGTSSSFAGGFSALTGGGGGTNTATIEILLTKGSSPNREARQLRDRMIEAGFSPEEVSIIPLASGMGSFDPNLFGLYVTGGDYAEVVRAATALTESLQDVSGLENVSADIAQTVNRPRFDIDPLKVAYCYQSQGLNPLEYQSVFYDEMYGMYMGRPIPDSTVDGKGLYVKGIMLGSAITAAPDGAETLSGVLISAGLTTPVRLADVSADVAVVSEPMNIKRIDGERSATISGTITKKDVGAVNSAVQQRVNLVMEDYDVTTTTGGVAEEMNRTFRDMGIAMIIAIVISFAIVVISFRSFLSALLIMISLPLASIGALLGLLVTGRTLGASGMMGMLMLVGIVLTNAIVLLALVDRLRREGMSTHDALILGGRTRIRPILMTAITTMIALLPLALGFGQGIMLASELAIVVLGGLFSSTLLTLIVIPVLYSLTDRFRHRVPVNVGFGPPEVEPQKPPDQ